ncbi:glutathione S-transferase family protein [Bosea sp. TAF32]|uniref:glutathione S-transferase family protein n=1 Tax=Bosea sp. TAF32 TaxID=3237482 RepID=UPI003F9122EF
MITLYSGPLSLFSRKVEIALQEKGLGFQRIMVPFNQTTGYDPKYPEVIALNPKGQVPVLSDCGLVLYDSTVINEYLDEAYPEPKLMPDSPVERARCRLDELYADEILFQAVKPLMHRTSPPSPDRVRRIAQEADALIAEEALTRHYEVLEQKLAGREFFGGRLSLADIALFMSVLFSLRLGGPPLDGYPGLAEWYTRLKLRPTFAQVVAEMAEADRRLSYPVAMRQGRSA